MKEERRLSPLIKNRNSKLESIDEEENSNDDGEIVSSLDNSAYTADPRYFTKSEYVEALQKAASVRDDERNRYSIMVKRISNDDFTKMQNGKLKKYRSTAVQPNQQKLQLQNKISSKPKIIVQILIILGLRRFQEHENSKYVKYCKMEDDYDECASLMCWKK